MLEVCESGDDRLHFKGFVKAYMYSHDTIYELLQYNLKRFENTKRMPEIHHSLVNTASLCTASVKLIGPCYASMGAFTIFISIVISLYYGRFELPFGFYLPGLDRATWIGYLLNLAFHILQVFEAVTGLLAADMCFFNLMINAVGQLDVMVIYLRKLGGAANTDKYEDALAEPELNELLSELIENHCEHRKYYAFDFFYRTSSTQINLQVSHEDGITYAGWFLHQ